MISKELLCEVLRIDERLCRIDKLIDNTLFFYTFNNVGEYQNYINIYELAHKCRLWAARRDWDLYLVFEGNKDRVSCELNYFRYGNIEFFAKTEIDVTFEACQFILDNEN